MRLGQGTARRAHGRVVAQGDLRPMQGNAEAMEDLDAILERASRCTARPTRRSTRRASTPPQSSPSCPGPWRGPDAASTTKRRHAMAETTAPLLSSRRCERSASSLTTPIRALRHWKLAFDGPSHAGAGHRRGRRHRPGYKLKLNSYDLGVDIELHDALQRIRFEHPRCAWSSSPARKDRIFCSGANIFMLGAVQPRLEGELLQVHQRDAQRPGGLEPPLGTQVRRRVQRRHAPAAATSWRWPATRSSWSTTVPPP